jgi:uncharacterized protein DUF1963
VVIDDRGQEHAASVLDGVWAVRVEASTTVVRFTDVNGAIVAEPLPEGERRIVGDAVEACPVCDALAWVQIADAVMCERCGYGLGRVQETSHGSSMSLGMGGGIAFRVAGPDDEVEESGGGFAFDAGEYLRRQQAALAAVDFPVYAASGCAASAHGRYDGAGEILVAHDLSDDSDDDNGYPDEEEDRDDGFKLLTVSTVPVGEARTQQPREALASMPHVGAPYDSRSAAARLVAFGARERALRREVALAVPVERELVIDGSPQTFTFLSAGKAWVGTRRHGPVDILVAASGLAPEDVELEPLADPADAQAGTIGDARRAAERARRDAAGELLTRGEVARLIDRHELGEHREAVLAAIRPGYWLEPGPSDSPHRIGGLPDLARSERWPHDERGFPLTFIAQIDCSALPPIASEFPLPEWGHGGALLRIFAALDARAPEPGPALALACHPGTPVARAELPPRPDPLPADTWEAEDESLRMLGELRVRLVPVLTAQAAWYAGIPDQITEAYERLAARLPVAGGRPRDAQWQIPQLLGHSETLQGEDPTSTGEYALPEIPRTSWGTLINIPDHIGMSFGDGGGLAIVIPLADLAAGRYDRLVTEPSMG